MKWLQTKYFSLLPRPTTTSMIWLPATRLTMRIIHASEFRSGPKKTTCVVTFRSCSAQSRKTQSILILESWNSRRLTNCSSIPARRTTIFKWTRQLLGSRQLQIHVQLFRPQIQFVQNINLIQSDLLMCTFASIFFLLFIIVGKQMCMIKWLNHRLNCLLLILETKY